MICTTDGMLRDVDIWEFYERVEKLILDLRSSAHTEESGEVEAALRGGSTSGEILGRLTSALTDVAPRVPDLSPEVRALAAWAKDASGLR